MARVKRGVTTRAKHKRLLDQAKGYRNQVYEVVKSLHVGHNIYNILCNYLIKIEQLLWRNLHPLEKAKVIIQ